MFNLEMTKHLNGLNNEELLLAVEKLAVYHAYNEELSFELMPVCLDKWEETNNGQ